MAEETRNSADNSEEQLRNREQGSTHDPEFEIPDPEQVEKDIERAEKEYGGSNQPKPTGDTNTRNERVA